MRKMQRVALPLNDLPGTTGSTPEPRELIVCFKAFHCHPSTSTLRAICFIAGNIGAIVVTITSGAIIASVV